MQLYQKIKILTKIRIDIFIYDTENVGKSKWEPQQFRVTFTAWLDRAVISILQAVHHANKSRAIFISLFLLATSSRWYDTVSMLVVRLMKGNKAPNFVSCLISLHCYPLLAALEAPLFSSSPRASPQFQFEIFYSWVLVKNFCPRTPPLCPLKSISTSSLIVTNHIDQQQ